MSFNVQTAALDAYAAQVGGAADDAKETQRYLDGYRHSGWDGVLIALVGDFHQGSYDAAVTALGGLGLSLGGSQAGLYWASSYYRNTDHDAAAGIDATFPGYCATRPGSVETEWAGSGNAPTFHDSMDPSGRLTAPPEVKYDHPLAFMDYMSVSHWALEGFNKVFGFNPLNEITAFIAGDWQAVAAAGIAFGNAADAVDDIAYNVQGGAIALRDSWQARPRTPHTGTSPTWPAAWTPSSGRRARSPSNSTGSPRPPGAQIDIVRLICYPSSGGLTRLPGALLAAEVGRSPSRLCPKCASHGPIVHEVVEVVVGRQRVGRLAVQAAVQHVLQKVGSLSELEVTHGVDRAPDAKRLVDLQRKAKAASRRGVVDAQHRGKLFNACRGAVRHLTVSAVIDGFVPDDVEVVQPATAQGEHLRQCGDRVACLSGIRVVLPTLKPRALRATNEQEGFERNTGQLRCGRAQPAVGSNVVLNQGVEALVKLSPARQERCNDRCSSHDFVGEEVPPEQVRSLLHQQEHALQRFRSLRRGPFGKFFQEVQGAIAGERAGSERPHASLPFKTTVALKLQDHASCSEQNLDGRNSTGTRFAGTRDTPRWTRDSHRRRHAAMG